MPSQVYKFNDDAIKNLFSAIKAHYKETDTNALEFSATGGQSGSDYFSLSSSSAAKGGLNLTQEKIIAALNQAINGSLTESSGTYSGTGGAVTAAKIAVVVNALKTAITNFDYSSAYNGTLSLNAAETEYTGTGNGVAATVLDDALNLLLTKIGGKVNTTDVATSVSSNNNNPVSSAAVATAIGQIASVSFHICTSGEYSGNIQSFNGDGSTKTFTLTDSPKTIKSVYINQILVSSYTYSTSNHAITFTDAPATGTSNIVVNYIPYPKNISSPSTSTFYLVPNNGSGTNNIYNEYICTDPTNGVFELIGSTENDFSEYVKYTELQELTAAQISALFTAAT